MRIFERLTYLLGTALAFTYGFEEFLASFILVCLILVCAFVGATVEGVRFIQWIYLVAFIPHIVLVVMDVYNMAALIIYCCFLAFAIIITWIYGEANFSRLSLVGPYQVGHQDMFTKDGIAVSVYYPMDKEEYDKEIGKTAKNSYWFRHGYRSRLGLSKATADWGKDNASNPWMF